jgi:hypothetical protein
VTQPRVTCDECKKTFSDFDAAKEHVLRVHGQGSIVPGGFVASIVVDGPITASDKAAIVEGRKDDSAKLPLDLIPPELLFAVAEILDFGAKKYGAYNWSKGMAWSRVFGALMRHMWAWWSGQDKDAETGKSHLWHAGCCIAFLIAYEARGTGTDDRPTK